MFGKVQNTLVMVVMLGLTATLAGCEDTTPEPRLATAKAKAKQCVEPTEVMRKNHMEFILHERDETVYEGIRSSKHSFKGCINCHIPASDASGKPVNYLTDDHTLNPDHFCATCHAYVGVKLDCFECHSDNPEGAAPDDSMHAAVKGGIAHE